MKYIMMAVWFITGLLIVPWLLGLVISIVGIGAIGLYFKLAFEVVGAVLARKVHSSLSLGLAIAAVVLLLEAFVGINVPLI